MGTYILNRFKEASTWRGIIAIITACGVAWKPELVNQIIAAGLGIIGALGAFFPDSKVVKDIQEVAQAVQDSTK